MGEYWEALTTWVEDRNADRQHTSEVIRAVGLRLFNLQLAKGKSVTPQQFLPFPWDEEVADDGGLSEMTEEQRKESLSDLMNKVKWYNDGD